MASFCRSFPFLLPFFPVRLFWSFYFFATVVAVVVVTAKHLTNHVVYCWKFQATHLGRHRVVMFVHTMYVVASLNSCRMQIQTKSTPPENSLQIGGVQCMIHVNDEVHGVCFFILFLHHFITITILPWLLCIRITKCAHSTAWPGMCLRIFCVFYVCHKVYTFKFEQLTVVSRWLCYTYWHIQYTLHYTLEFQFHRFVPSFFPKWWL